MALNPTATLAAQIRSQLRQRLDPERFCHVMGVETFAVAIADATGVRKDKALLAALLHDFCKNDDRATLTAALEGARRFRPTEEDWRHPSVWHGLAAAELALSRFGVEDAEVLEAVAFHTTGIGPMSPVGLVLFVADFIEPSRNFPGVEKFRRELMGAGLAQAAARVAEEKLERVVKKGRAVHSRSRRMAEWLSQTTT